MAETRTCPTKRNRSPCRTGHRLGPYDFSRGIRGVRALSALDYEAKERLSEIKIRGGLIIPDESRHRTAPRSSVRSLGRSDGTSYVPVTGRLELSDGL